MCFNIRCICKLYIWQFFLFLFGAVHVYPIVSDDRPKILHLTYHRGCQKELEGIARELSLNLTTWFIPETPKKFDGQSDDNRMYNIGHDRAKKVWELHKEYFYEFDIIITSDTAPLARIFLQNGWQKKLIIWICNRFDYHDACTLDCDFPDKEYYELMSKAASDPNVVFIAYTAFEHYWCQSKGIRSGNLTITPCGFLPEKNVLKSSIPSEVIKSETYFLPPYHNETIYMNLSEHLTSLGIVNYCGRYEGPLDLENFKGIICLPYSWSNLALFENLQLGIPYFIPSKEFFKTLASKKNYFYPNLQELIAYDLFDLAEWYDPTRKDLFIYFDSWSDLLHKISTTDFSEKKRQIKNYAENYKQEIVSKWKKIFIEK